MRWTDSIPEATGLSLREPSRAAEDRTVCTSLNKGGGGKLKGEQHKHIQNMDEP